MNQFLKFILDPEIALSSSHHFLVLDTLRFYFLTTRVVRWDRWGCEQVCAVVWSRETSGLAEAERVLPFTLAPATPEAPVTRITIAGASRQQGSGSRLQVPPWEASSVGMAGSYVGSTPPS